MPFNSELEDFAKAFSSGYAGTKSKQERESEALDLKHKQFVVERDPITAAQADESHAIEMERARGEISDAEAARRQNEILYPLQAREAAARATGAEQTVEVGEHALTRRPKLEADEDRFNAAKIAGAETELEVSGERLKLLQEGNTDEAKEWRRRAHKAELTKAEADAAVAEAEANPDNIALKQRATKLQGDAYAAQIARDNAATLAIPSEVKLRESTTRHQDAESEKMEMTNDLFANAKKAAQRLQGGGSQPLDEPAEAVDPSLPGAGYGRTGSGEPVIPALQPKPPSWNKTSAVEVPQSTIGTHDDESEGITKGSKSSPTSKTMRKLKNGEIPSFSDLIDVGVEASVEAAKSAADDAGINDDEAVSTPGSELNFSNWLSGAHGADAEVAQMAIETVKEASGGRLSPQQEALSTTGLGYLTFSLAGMPDEALNFAKGMQGYAQQLTGQYAAFAKAAAMKGDIDGTTMGLMKSYLNIGNGKDLDIRPDPKHEGMFIAKITDLKTGKVEEEHVVSPDEMVGKAMGVTPGTSMEILNAAAGNKDETISDAAARVLAAEYKQYGLTAEEISRMTTAEFEKVQERLEKDIADRKPKEYTLEQSKEAASQIDDALEKFKESNPDQYRALKLDDPTAGTVEDLIPAASQVLLYNSETGMDKRRALRATINLAVNGPSEPVMNLPDGRLLVSVAGVDPFVMSANEYTILTANRRKYGVPTASGLPPDAQRYSVGDEGASADGGPAIPEPAVPVAAPPSAGTRTRFSRVPVAPPQYGPPIPVRPGTNPPQSGARTRF